MEETKRIVEKIVVFHYNFIDAPIEIQRMTYYDKESIIHSYTKCLEMGIILDNKEYKIGHVCSEIENHPRNIIKDLNLLLLFVNNKLTTINKILDKLKEYHLKRVFDVSTLKNFTKEIMEIFSIIMAKTIARLKESMIYHEFRLSQSMVWKMVLGVEVEWLFVSMVK